jgi:hypothetical protein
MKKPGPSKEQSAAKVAIITAIVTAASAISVAFIGIVPQLREADAQKIKGMQNEIDSLKQSVGAISGSNPEGKSGTPTNRTNDIQAPQIQLRWSQIDPEMSQVQYISRGKEALDRGGFRGIGTNENVIYGFDREYTGMVFSVTPGKVIFVVSGLNWQVADSKAENLRRGF